MSLSITLTGHSMSIGIDVPTTPTGTNILALLHASGMSALVRVCAVEIRGLTAAGASRPKVQVASPRDGSAAVTADDFASHGIVIPAGTGASIPADDFAQRWSIRSDTAHRAICTVCW
jgi:hypothetical protein